MAEQVTGNLVTEITALPAMNGRLIYLHLKNPQVKKEHKFFLPPGLCGKLFPLLVQAMGLAQEERQKAGVEKEASREELRATQVLVLSDAAVTWNNAGALLDVELNGLTTVRIQMSADQAAKLAADLSKPTKPAPAGSNAASSKLDKSRGRRK